MVEEGNGWGNKKEERKQERKERKQNKEKNSTNMTDCIVDFVFQRAHNTASKGDKINPRRHNKHCEGKHTLSAFVLIVANNVAVAVTVGD